MAALFRNNVAGVLASNIGPSDTLILLNAGQGAAFPEPVTADGDYFYATIVHAVTGVIEIVRCTERAGDMLTVQRGRDSTGATSFTAGSVLEMRLVAAILNEVDYRTVRGVVNGLAPTDASNYVPMANISPLVARQTALVEGLATKQNLLGFVPVQQGGGAGQGANKIRIGWASDASGLKAAVDSTDLGVIAFRSWVQADFMLKSARSAANGVAPLNASSLVPANYIAALGYVPLSGNATIAGNWAKTGNTQHGGDLTVYRTTAPNTGVLYLTETNSRRLYFDGTEYSFNTSNVTAPNFIATSDRRMKKRLREHSVDLYLPFRIQLKDWQWKDGGAEATGVVAQEVDEYAPQHVTHGKTLGVDKAGLALEAVVALAAYVKHMENSHALR